MKSNRTVRRITSYLERIGIAVSILLNVLLGGASNQTFSARNYKWQQENKPNIVWLIDKLFFFDRYHCFHSWIYYKTTKDLRKSHIKSKITVDIDSRIRYIDYYEE